MDPRNLLPVGVLAVGLAVVTVPKLLAAPVIEQPIPFSHKKHLVGEHAPKLACRECHTGVETQAAAGLPPLDRCLQCHMKPQSSAEGEKVVRELAAKGGDFQWRPVTSNRKHVYVSHRGHVGIGKIGCPTCHGEVTEWDGAPRSANKALLNMDRCLECHREHSAPTNCITCHR